MHPGPGLGPRDTHPNGRAGRQARPEHAGGALSRAGRRRRRRGRRGVSWGVAWGGARGRPVGGGTPTRSAKPKGVAGLPSGHPPAPAPAPLYRTYGYRTPLFPLSLQCPSLSRVRRTSDALYYPLRRYPLYPLPSHLPTRADRHRRPPHPLPPRTESRLTLLTYLLTYLDSQGNINYGTLQHPAATL